jgi:hypothetical protein
MKEHLLADPRVKIPKAMINIIVDTFTSTSGRGTAEEEIAQAMAKPFTVAKMRLLIRKKSNTAPGLTGLTYQMLGLLPDEATLDLFKLMERMWGAKHVPEFWKLKGLKMGYQKLKWSRASMTFGQSGSLRRPGSCGLQWLRGGSSGCSGAVFRIITVGGWRTRELTLP